MNHLPNNIRYLRELKGLSIRKLESILEVGRGNVYNWEKDKTAPPIDLIIKLSHFFQVKIDTLLQRDLEKEQHKGTDSHYKSDNNGVAEPNSNYESENLFIPATVQAGYGIANSPIFTNPIIVNIPGIKGEARTFEITGDSMMPLIFDGDYVVCKRLASAEDIEEHEVYVIATRRDGIMAKYLSVTENGLLCMSENSTYNPSFLIEFDEVIEIWIVKMLITGKLKRPSITPGGISLVKRLEILEEYMEDFLPDKDD